MPDDGNHALHGAFILAAPHGHVEDARLLDIGPTLLELGGYERPSSMQGGSLMAGRAAEPPRGVGYSSPEEKEVHDRLSGLGYLG